MQEFNFPSKVLLPLFTYSNFLTQLRWPIFCNKKSVQIDLQIVKKEDPSTLNKTVIFQFHPNGHFKESSTFYVDKFLKFLDFLPLFVDTLFIEACVNIFKLQNPFLPTPCLRTLCMTLMHISDL